MKVFVDANILLDLYKFSETDLKELEKLCQFVGVGRIELLASRHVVHEFYRNRERVIAEAFNKFKSSKIEIHEPNIARSYDKCGELRKLANQASKAKKSLEAQIARDINNESLPSEKIINRLLSVLKVGEVDDLTYERAKHRCAIGHPPGKNGSLGDAISWEWLLHQEFGSNNDRVVLLSSDRDFQSELHPKNLKQFLKKEWSDNQHCEIILKTSFSSFLAEFLPEIELVDEMAKDHSIELLETSHSFKMTHDAIENLQTYEEFSKHEVERMIRAYLENNQIMSILGDFDVKQFAIRLISLPCRDDELRSLLEDALQDLDNEEGRGDFF